MGAVVIYAMAKNARGNSGKRAPKTKAGIVGTPAESGARGKRRRREKTRWGIRAISRLTNLYSGSSDLSAASLTTAGPGAAPGKKGREAALIPGREGELPADGEIYEHSYGFPHFRGKSLSTIFLQRIFDAAIVDSSTRSKLWPIVERKKMRRRVATRGMFPVPLRIKFGQRALRQPRNCHL